MVSEETKSVIARAKEIYEERLRTCNETLRTERPGRGRGLPAAVLLRAPRRDLEANHTGRFVAIEPDSGDYFIGETFDEAVKSARLKYPSRLSHTIRIGHAAAFHLGEMNR